MLDLQDLGLVEKLISTYFLIQFTSTILYYFELLEFFSVSMIIIF